MSPVTCMLCAGNLSGGAGRDRDYIELNKRFTIDVFVGGQIIRLFPDVLKPCVDLFPCSLEDRQTLRRVI